MRLRAHSALLDNSAVSAVLTTDHSASSYGIPVLVLGNGEPLGVEDAMLADYRIVEATDEERTALVRAGYPLPDE